jgi:hypothetical protein
MSFVLPLCAVTPRCPPRIIPHSETGARHGRELRTCWHSANTFPGRMVM